MDLAKLRKSLPSGYREQAANDLKCSISTINNMIYGKRKMNDSELEYFVNMAERNEIERKEKINYWASLSKRIDKLSTN